MLPETVSPGRTSVELISSFTILGGASGASSGGVAAGRANVLGFRLGADVAVGNGVASSSGFFVTCGVGLAEGVADGASVTDGRAAIAITGVDVSLGDGVSVGVDVAAALSVEATDELGEGDEAARLPTSGAHAETISAAAMHAP